MTKESATETLRRAVYARSRKLNMAARARDLGVTSDAKLIANETEKWAKVIGRQHQA